MDRLHKLNNFFVGWLQVSQQLAIVLSDQFMECEFARSQFAHKVNLTENLLKN